MSKTTHTKIIWEAMSVMVTNDHPVIYQYIKGKVRSRDTAVSRLAGIVAPVFIGAYDIAIIRGVARKYLEQKEVEYNNGQIKIKSIYNR